MYTAEIFAVLAKTVLICELSLLLQKSELRCQSEEVVLLIFLAEIQWKNFIKSVGLESHLASCMKTEWHLHMNTEQGNFTLICLACKWRSKKVKMKMLGYMYPCQSVLIYKLNYWIIEFTYKFNNKRLMCVALKICILWSKSFSCLPALFLKVR